MSNYNSNYDYKKKEKPCYDIVRTRYMYTPTGEVLDDGRLVRVREENVKKDVLKNTNFSDLKKDIYNKTQTMDNVYVNYYEPAYVHRQLPRKIKSVVKTFEDGSKEVTYYNAKKGKK